MKYFGLNLEKIELDDHADENGNVKTSWYDMSEKGKVFDMIKLPKISKSGFQMVDKI